MPAPRSLTTAPHRDFELEVVAGAWPDDISGEVLFSSPLNGHGLPYAHLRLRRDLPARRSNPAPAAPRPAASAGRASSIETPGKRLWNRHPELFTVGPTGYLSPFGPPNCVQHRAAARGATASTPPGTPGDRSSCTPGPSSSWPRSATSTAGAAARSPMGGVLPFLLSSAHPVADPERHCLWTVKLDLVTEPTVGMRPSLVRYDRDDGTQVRYWPLDGHHLRRLRPHRQPDPRLGDPRRLGQLQGRPRRDVRRRAHRHHRRRGPRLADPQGRARGPAVGHARHARSASRCRRPTATTTPAGTTPTASRWCGRAWTSWTSPSTCGPTTSTSTATPSTPARWASTTWPWRPRPSSRWSSTPRAARSSSGASTRRTGRSTSSSRPWTGAPRA